MSCHLHTMADRADSDVSSRLISGEATALHGVDSANRALLDYATMEVDRNFDAKEAL